MKNFALRFCFLFFYCLILHAANAQGGPTGYRGLVIDQNQLPIMQAKVVVQFGSDATKQRTAITDSTGWFSFRFLKPGVTISIDAPGYQTYVNTNFSPGAFGVDTFVLFGDQIQLKDFTLHEKNPVRMKGDTTEYNAGSFKTNPDATAEDLVNKMPGITNQNGQINAQGEQVQQVLVDGKPFFGNDPNSVLKNIPSEIIDKIQVFDKKSDQSVYSGVDDGNSSKTMNIVTKPQFRNGKFGRVYAGAGPEGKYKAGGNYNTFSKNRRISFVGQWNNINEQNFSAEDLAGVVGSSGGGNRPGGMGGGRGGAGGGAGGGRNFNGGDAASNFLVDQSSGITTSRAFGINYMDKWGKKVDVSGSWFMNSSSNNAISQKFRQYLQANQTGLTYTENTTNLTENLNNRVNFRLEWKPDTTWSILWQPRISFQHTTGNKELNSLNQQNESYLNTSINQTITSNNNYNISTPLNIRKNFNGLGRGISLSVNPTFTKGFGQNNLNAGNRYYTSSLFDSLNQQTATTKYGNTVSNTLSYTEPIDSNSMLELRAVYSAQWDDNNKSTFKLPLYPGEYSQLDTQLSNVFNNTYRYVQGGAFYKYTNKSKSFNITAGTVYQIARLAGNQQFPNAGIIDRTFRSWLPNVQIQFKKGNSQTLRVNYRSGNNAPSLDQLQQVLNNSNPVQLSIGNPNLNQETQHNLNVRYNLINAIKNRSLFLLVGGSLVNNYIGNSLYTAAHGSRDLNGITLNPGTQLTMPVNLNGYKQFRSFAFYSTSLPKKWGNLGVNIGANWSSTPALFNDVANTTKNPSISGGLNWSSGSSEKYDWNFNTTTGLNWVKNQLRPQVNSSYLSQTTRFKLNLMPWKGLVISSDVTHTYWSGLSSSFNQQFILWNAAIGYKFLKNKAGDIRLYGFDILNQNKAISRSVTETYIEDQLSNAQRRYVMLIFTYSIRPSGKNFQMPSGDSPPPHGMMPPRP